MSRTSSKKNNKEQGSMRDVLKLAMNLIHEVQDNQEDIKKNIRKEAVKVFGKLQETYHELGSKLSVVGDIAKQQAEERVQNLMEQWDSQKETISKKLMDEVDGVLNKLWPKNKKAAKPRIRVTVTKSKQKAATPKASPKKTASKAPAKTDVKAKVKAKSSSRLEAPLQDESKAS